MTPSRGFEETVINGHLYWTKACPKGFAGVDNASEAAVPGAEVSRWCVRAWSKCNHPGRGTLAAKLKRSSDIQENTPSWRPALSSHHTLEGTEDLLKQGECTAALGDKEGRGSWPSRPWDEHLRDQEATEKDIKWGSTRVENQVLVRLKDPKDKLKKNENQTKWKQACAL